MSRKSASAARRLFAAAQQSAAVVGRDVPITPQSPAVVGRDVPITPPPQSPAVVGRDVPIAPPQGPGQCPVPCTPEVVHKEGKKEKETFPPTPPYKEKEKKQETTGSGSVSGSRVRVRVGEGTFFDPSLDPVTVAVAVFGGNRDDRRLWRWYLYRIGEDAFRQLSFTQWRENRSDGMPDNPPACFQCKLTAALKAQSAAVVGRDVPIAPQGPKGGAR